MTYFVMALALVLGFTQCKKEQPTPQNETEGLFITLDVENGSKHEVIPATGVVNFQDGDVIYVGDGYTYIGTLNRTNGRFSGTVNTPNENATKLHFYFLGGKTPTDVPTEGITTDFTISIADQSNNLPVLAYNSVDYTGGGSYFCTLKNQCALVEFDLGEVSTDAAITLTGMKTEATIGFNGTMTNLSTTGDIVTYGTGSTRYAIVLSDQGAVEEGTISAEGYEGTFSIPTAAFANAFLTDASMNLTATPASHIVDLTTQTGNYNAQDGDVLTGELASPYEVTIAAGATITLEDATISGGVIGLGNVTIILSNVLLETNTVSNTNGPGIRVTEDNTLVIRGDGSLTATGASGCAGIGSGYTAELACGDIEIQSGTVIANGGASAAGIGTGGVYPYNQLGVNCGDITISGGTVIAQGDSMEITAGIGTGAGGGQCGDITISDGTITAIGGGHTGGGGAGIGAGYSDAGDITISGGTVTATGGGTASSAGTGIGVGGGHSVGFITLSGGDITATGGGSKQSPIYGIGGSAQKCKGIVITTGVVSVEAIAFPALGKIYASPLIIDEMEYSKDPTGTLGVNQVLQATNTGGGGKKPWTLTHIE